MFMKRSIIYVVSAMLLLLLPGCTRYVKWPHDVFYQGEKQDQWRACVQDYLRYVRVYDQFSTRGLFDVLWLSNDVRRAFVSTRACKKSLTTELKDALLRRQLEENNHYIVFYVLTPVAYDHASSLSHPNSYWSVCLNVDGEIYRPIEIKKIELQPEYIDFLPYTCSRARIAYQIRFNAKDMNDSQIICCCCTRCIRLVFSSAARRSFAEWKFDSNGRMCMPRLQRRWPIAYDL